MKKIKIHPGDITRLNVTAIVNAANSSLLGGGGVDGSIHRAAGPELLNACRLLKGCATGQAKITKGYQLPAKYVIHTVGPIWHGGNHHEAELLKSCYLQCLKIAEDKRFDTLAFPNISTGVYGFPKEEAADIALSTVETFLSQHAFPETVIFVLFDEENLNIYKKQLSLND